MIETYFPYLLIIITLLICTVGFYRLVYFLNIGYAFSIAAMAIVASIFYQPNLTWLSILQNAALTAWGLRLGIFILKREFRASYQKEKRFIQDKYGNVKTAMRIGIWIVVALLYYAMFSPSYYTLSSTALKTSSVTTMLRLLGFIFMAGGLFLETIADQQKSRFKTTHPKRFCNTGLYQKTRSPNYLGEMLFWVGNWVMGIGGYTHIYQWTISLLGLITIIWIMLWTTKRLEKEQTKRYGEISSYQEYTKTVPILIPGVPLYSLEHSKLF